MRVYLGSTMQQLISTATLCLALGVFGWVAWKAVDTWTADPTLEQIQQIRESM